WSVHPPRNRGARLSKQWTQELRCGHEQAEAQQSPSEASCEEGREGQSQQSGGNRREMERRHAEYRAEAQHSESVLWTRREHLAGLRHVLRTESARHAIRVPAERVPRQLGRDVSERETESHREGEPAR